jgi:hypothetical protein
MGSAASQRRMKRMKYLARLAKEEPERFDKEWERRLTSWLKMIGRDAGIFKDDQCRPVQPVFDLIEEALTILERCGDAVYVKYARDTFDLLSNECCKQFAVRVDPRLYRLNN